MVRENWCVKNGAWKMVRDKWCVKNGAWRMVRENCAWQMVCENWCVKKVREKWCVKKVREYSKSGAERLRENCVKKGAWKKSVTFVFDIFFHAIFTRVFTTVFTRVFTTLSRRFSRQFSRASFHAHFSRTFFTRGFSRRFFMFVTHVFSCAGFHTLFSCFHALFSRAGVEPKFSCFLVFFFTRVPVVAWTSWSLVVVSESSQRLFHMLLDGLAIVLHVVAFCILAWGKSDFFFSRLRSATQSNLKFGVCETHVWNLIRFWLFSGPCWVPFFTIGGHYFDSGGLEWWDLCILWATWFQVRFWSKIRWVSEVFWMVKTMVWCGRGWQNHSFSGTWIFSIWDSILMVFLTWKQYQSWHMADFGGPRGTHGGYLEQV